MSKIYHSTDNLDVFEARTIADTHQEEVEAAGGTITAPESFVSPPVVLVLELPDEVSPSSVFPNMNFVEYVG